MSRLGRSTRTALVTLAFALAAAGCRHRERVIHSLQDAETARIGVMTGSTGEILAHERFPHAEIKVFDDIMDGVAAVRSGQLEGVITAYPTAIQLTKKNPDFYFLQDALSKEDSAIAVRKGNKQLLDQLNEIILSVQKDGTLADMKRRWLKQDLSPYEEKRYDVPTVGEPLKIGVAATREPISFVDDSGRISGHDGELARLIGARLHRPLEFSNMKFMALIPSLASGKIDAIITGISVTGERRKNLDFTIPYFANGQVMIVKRHGDSGMRLAGTDDVRTARIGALQGSGEAAWATETYPMAMVEPYPSPAGMVLAVETGKADAALCDTDDLKQILNDHPEMALLGAPVASSDLAFGFPRDDARLREQFNTFLAQMRSSGQWNALVHRWVEQGAAQMPSQPAPVTHGDLRVGISSDAGLPLLSKVDGRLTGMNIELLERFAALAGRRIQYVDLDSSGLIAALAAHRIDMIGAVISISAERSRLIAFSDPYYRQQINFFALKKNMAAYGAAQGESRTGIRGFTQRAGESFRSNILTEKRYLLLLDGLWTTLLLAILSTVLGTVLGALVCFLRMSPRPLFRRPAKLYIAILRGTPVLVLLMLVFYVVFASVNISPVLVAVIAFGMNFAAYAAEIFRTGIEGIDRGQREAGIAMGFTPAQTFFHILLPQMIRRVLPIYKGEFISLVKMTSIVGYIAVQDLTKAGDIIRSRTFDAFFPLIMVAVLYFILSWILVQLLEVAERAVNPGGNQGARA